MAASRLKRLSEGYRYHVTVGFAAVKVLVLAIACYILSVPLFIIGLVVESAYSAYVDFVAEIKARYFSKKKKPAKRRKTRR